MPCNQYQGPYASEEEEKSIHEEKRQKILDDATRAACSLGKVVFNKDLKITVEMMRKIISQEDFYHVLNWYKSHCEQDKKREDK